MIVKCPVDFLAAGFVIATLFITCFGTISLALTNPEFAKTAKQRSALPAKQVRSATGYVGRSLGSLISPNKPG